MPPETYRQGYDNPPQIDHNSPPTLGARSTEGHREPTGREMVGQVPAPSATRYLSAGAYLDPAFRDQVVETILNQEHTAVAPSYSIDVVPVLKHCLAAARRQRVADLLVTGVVVLGVIVSFRQTVTLICAFYSLMAALKAFAGFSRRDLVSAAMYLLLALALSIVTLVTADSLLANTESADSSAVSGGAGRLIFTLFVATVGAAGVQVWHQVSIHRLLLEEFTPEGFRPEAAPRPQSKHQERIEYLAEAQHGNVTIYGQARRGNPFLGCGRVSEAWSLALPLVPDPDQNREPEPLSVNGLYRDMRKALISLANPREHEDQRIKGLSLQQRIFVSGLLPRNHELLDAHRQPRLDIGQAEVDRLSQDERSRSTQLLTVRVNGWDGELDVTVLLYFSVRGNMLYTEFTACSLAPITADYHQIDTLELMGSSVYQRAILKGVISAPGALVRCPMAVVNPAIQAIQRNLDVRGQLQRIASQLSFDYGATTSVRELGADSDTKNLFHKYDSDRYIKIVNRRVIEAITEVLETHGYSNTDFVQRTSVYIDQSMNIISGNRGDVVVAKGTNARAEQSGGSRAKARAAGGPSA